MVEEDLQVRQIVREELATRADAIGMSSHTTFGRTQSLSRGAARSAVKELSIHGHSSMAETSHINRLVPSCQHRAADIGHDGHQELDIPSLPMPSHNIQAMFLFSVSYVREKPQSL